MGSRLRVGNYTRFTAKRLPNRYAGPMQNALYGIAAEKIALLCKVNIATARRWKAGTSRVPYVVSCWLESGLHLFRSHWPGWSLTEEAIVSPDGWRINRNHALSVALMEAQIKQRDARIKQLQDEIDYLKSVHALQDQPAPQDLPEIKNIG